MENNKQFRISIEQHISNMYNHALTQFYKSSEDLRENPRAFWAKEEYSKYLAQKQTFESLIHHIEDGSYDSEEFYKKYLNPKTKVI